MTAKRERSKPQKPQINVIGMAIVVFALWGGIMLTNKRKDN